MSVNFDMRLRTLSHLLPLGSIPQESTIQNILDIAKDAIVHLHADWPEANLISNGYQFKLLFHNECLPNDITIAQLVRQGVISGRGDDFFYKCRLLAVRS